jgi:hypothetical protein
MVSLAHIGEESQEDPLKPWGRSVSGDMGLSGI